MSVERFARGGELCVEFEEDKNHFLHYMDTGFGSLLNEAIGLYCLILYLYLALACFVTHLFNLSHLKGLALSFILCCFLSVFYT